MRRFLRALAAEFCKMKHSGILLVHLLVPLGGALLFLLYYQVSPWDEADKISGYYEVAAAAYPIMIAVVVGMSVGWEEENHFQRLLAGESRIFIFGAKFLSMFLLGLAAAAVAAGAFQAGFFLLSGGNMDDLLTGMRTGAEMSACIAAVNVSLYLIHLFLNLRFGRTASILTGFTGSVLGMLTLTGLGEGLWQFIPYSMAGRMAGYVGLLEYGGWEGQQRLLLLEELQKAVPGICVWSLGLAIFTFVWFHRWEGHDCFE